MFGALFGQLPPLRRSPSGRRLVVDLATTATTLTLRSRCHCRESGNPNDAQQGCHLRSRFDEASLARA
jgi:hypothetical protein